MARCCCWKICASIRARRRTSRTSPPALAKLGDLYVDDAFSAAHRAHASIEGIADMLPAYAGRGMEAELTALDKALGNPTHPVAAMVGGAKISTKLDLLGNLVAKVDMLIWAAAWPTPSWRRAASKIGKSLVERDMLDTARAIIEQGRRATAAPSCCRSMRWSPRSSAPARPPRPSRPTPCPTTG